MKFTVLSIKDIIERVGLFIKDIFNGITDFFVDIYNFDFTGPEMIMVITNVIGFVIIICLYYIFLKFLVWLWDFVMDIISKFDKRSREYKFFRDDKKLSKLQKIITEEGWLFLILWLYVSMLTADSIDFKPLVLI